MKVVSGSNIPAYPKIRGDLANIHYPCYLETKLDGEANVYFSGYLISKSSGKIRYDFPVTAHLKPQFDDKTVLFGELYWEEGMFGALYDLLSHANDKDLKYGIFDVGHQNIDGATYEERREWLLQRFTPTPFCRMIDTQYCESRTELDAALKANKQNGYEGMVVKNADSILISNGQVIITQTGWVKLKHKFTDDCVLCSLDPTLERGEVQLQSGRTCGVKIVNKYKKHVKVGDVLEIEHQGILSGGSLRHPVYRGKKVVS